MALLSFLLISAISPGLTDVDSGQWFRGNIHTHTLWSDGDDFPEMVVDWYRRNGYHFLALSDHNVLSRGDRWMYTRTVRSRSKVAAVEKYRRRFGDDWVELRGEGAKEEVRLKPLAEFRDKFESAGKFLLMEGEEITASFRRLPIHINATNLLEKIDPQRGGSVRDVIRKTLQAVALQSEKHGRPILAHLNHPNFGYAVTAEDLAHVVEERFFEVYNGHPAVGQRGDSVHCSVERMWDIANAIRIGVLGEAPLFGVATDDSHNYHGNEGSLTGRGWVVVRARELKPESLIRSMESGDFYASSGVVLRDVSFDRGTGTLQIAIDPQPGARYTIEFIGTKRTFDRTSQPQCDKEGNPLENVTRKYSSSIGEVLRTVEGTDGSYRCQGDELYVRGVVTSSLEVERPVWPGQRRHAWTQPVMPGK